MNSSTNLLVEQDILSEPVYLQIHAYAELAQTFGPGVDTQLTSEEVFILLSRHIDNLAILELEMNAFDLSPQPYCWKVEVYFAVRTIIYWSGEDFSARHIVNGIADYRNPIFDREFEVRLIADQPDLVGVFHYCS